MKRYIALVEKDPDSTFGIRFPDVPGCFSAADDEADILPNAIEALTLHLEGLDLPDARGAETLTQDDDVSEALRDGAYMVSVPLVTTRNRQVRVNISIDKGTLEAIDSAAAMRGMTRSGFLAEAALNEIQETKH